MNVKAQLFTVAVALMIPLGVNANDIPEEFEFLNVHKTSASFTIDGDLSDWSFANPIVDPLIGVPKVGQGDRVEGDEPTEYVIHEELGGTWTGLEDQSSSMQLYWTDDGVYMSVVVTDDYHENAAVSGWNGDAIQMMVATADRADDFALYNYALGGVEEDIADPDPDFPTTLVANHEKGFEFFDTDDTTLAGTEDEPNVAIVRDTDALTTTYEIFLPSDAIGLDPDEFIEGAQFGLGMSINDGDEEPENGQKGWVGLGAHAIVFGKSPGETALMTLAGEADVTPMCDPNTMGDIDGSGDVAFADFLILSQNFGQAATDHTTGDIDCSGDVAFADFLVLSANFGQTVGGAQSVPEPSTFGLLGFSLLCLGMFRRRS